MIGDIILLLVVVLVLLVVLLLSILLLSFFIIVIIIIIFYHYLYYSYYHYYLFILCFYYVILFSFCIKALFTKKKIKSRKGESVDCMKKKERYFMEKLKVKNDTLEARKIGEGRLFLWDEEKKSEKKKKVGKEGKGGFQKGLHGKEARVVFQSEWRIFHERV